MSGVEIQVTAQTEDARKKLEELNASLAKLFLQTENSGGAFKNFSANLANQAQNAMRLAIHPLAASVRSLSRGFKSLGSTAVQSLHAIAGAATRLTSTIFSLRNSITLLVTSLAGLGAMSYLNRAADSLVNIQNYLSLVIDSQDEVIRRQRQIMQIGRESRGDWKAATASFVDLTQALSTRGNASPERVLNVLKTINQMNALSGSTPARIEGAMVQLNQGISMGSIQGRELLSMMKYQKYMANSLMRELNMGPGQFREFASSGALTANMFVDLIERSAVRTQAAFERTQWKVEDAAREFRLSLSFFFGDINQYIGFSENLAKRLLTFADYFKSAADRVVMTLIRLQLTGRSVFQSLVEATREKLLGDSLSKTADAAEKELGRIKSVINAILREFSKPRSQGENEFVKTGKVILDSFKVSFETLLSILPVFLRKINLFGEEILIAVNTKIQRTAVNTFAGMIPFFDAVEELAEKVTFSLWVDKKIERSWYNLFKSTSIREFRENLEAVNAARRETRFQTLPFIGKEAYRGSIQSYILGLKEIGIGLGILERKVNRVGDLRFDRAVVAYQVMASSLQRIYRRVIYPITAPVLYELNRSITMLFSGISKNIKNTFTEQYMSNIGFKAGVALVRGLHLAIKGIKKLFSSIFQGGIKSNASSGLVSIFRGVFSRILTLIKSFVKGVHHEIDQITGIFSWIAREIQAETLWQTLGIALGTGLVKLSHLVYRLIEGIFGLFSRPDVETKGLETFVTIMKKIFLALFSFIKGIVIGIVREIDKITGVFTNISLGLKNETFQKAVYLVAKMVHDILVVTQTGLTYVVHFLKSFGKTVVNIFAYIYDKIVGNSFWVDTIDGINAHTGRLKDTESFISAFGRKVTEVFRNIYNKILESGIFKQEIVLQIRAMLTLENLDNVLSTISLKMTGVLLSGLMLLFGGTVLRIAALSYLMDIFSISVDGFITLLVPTITHLVNWIFQEFSTAIVRAGVRIFDILTDVLPSFIIDKLVSSVVDPESIIGQTLKAYLDHLFMLTNKLFLTVGVIIAALWLFNASLRKSINSFIFGKEAKKGKPATLGVMDYLFAAFGKDYREKRDTKRIHSPAILTAGFVALGSVVLDNVNAFAALSAAIPLMLFGIFGLKAGGRMSSFFFSGVERGVASGVASAGRKGKGFAQSFQMSALNTLIDFLGKKQATPGSFRDALLNDLTKTRDYQLRKDKRSLFSIMSPLFEMAGKGYTNFQKNADAWGQSKMSFWDAVRDSNAPTKKRKGKRRAKPDATSINPGGVWRTFRADLTKEVQKGSATAAILNNAISNFETMGTQLKSAATFLKDQWSAFSFGAAWDRIKKGMSEGFNAAKVSRAGLVITDVFNTASESFNKFAESVKKRWTDFDLAETWTSTKQRAQTKLDAIRHSPAALSLAGNYANFRDSIDLFTKSVKERWTDFSLARTLARTKENLFEGFSSIRETPIALSFTGGLNKFSDNLKGFTSKAKETWENFSLRDTLGTVRDKARAGVTRLGATPVGQVFTSVFDSITGAGEKAKSTARGLQGAWTSFSASAMPRIRQFGAELLSVLSPFSNAVGGIFRRLAAIAFVASASLLVLSQSISPANASIYDEFEGAAGNLLVVFTALAAAAAFAAFGFSKVNTAFSSIVDALTPANERTMSGRWKLLRERNPDTDINILREAFKQEEVNRIRPQLDAMPRQQFGDIFTETRIGSPSWKNVPEIYMKSYIDFYEKFYEKQIQKLIENHRYDLGSRREREDIARSYLDNKRKFMSAKNEMDRKMYRAWMHRDVTAMKEFKEMRIGKPGERKFGLLGLDPSPRLNRGINTPFFNQARTIFDVSTEVEKLTRPGRTLFEALKDLYDNGRSKFWKLSFLPHGPLYKNIPHPTTTPFIAELEQGGALKKHLAKTLKERHTNIQNLRREIETAGDSAGNSSERFRRLRIELRAVGALLSLRDVADSWKASLDSLSGGNFTYGRWGRGIIEGARRSFSKLPAIIDKVKPKVKNALGGLMRMFVTAAGGIASILAPIALIGSAGAVWLYFFGPGDTFTQKLAYAYDLLRSMFGLKPTTNFGRYFESVQSISSMQLFGLESLTGINSDLQAELLRVDFSSMSSRQFEGFQAVIDNAKQKIDGIQSESISAGRFGQYTPTELRTIEQTLVQIRQAILRQPQYDGLDARRIAEQLERFSTDVSAGLASNSDWRAVSSIFSGIGTIIKVFFQMIWEIIKVAFIIGMVGLALSVMPWLLAAFGGALWAAITVITAIVYFFKDIWNLFASSAIGQYLGRFFLDLGEGLRRVGVSIWDFVKSVDRAIMELAGSQFNPGASGIEQVYEYVFPKDYADFIDSIKQDVSPEALNDFQAAAAGALTSTAELLSVFRNVRPFVRGENFRDERERSRGAPTAVVEQILRAPFSDNEDFLDYLNKRMNARLNFGAFRETIQTYRNSNLSEETLTAIRESPNVEPIVRIALTDFDQIPEEIKVRLGISDRTSFDALSFLSQEVPDVRTQWQAAADALMPWMSSAYLNRFEPAQTALANTSFIPKETPLVLELSHAMENRIFSDFLILQANLENVSRIPQAMSLFDADPRSFDSQIEGVVADIGKYLILENVGDIATAERETLLSRQNRKDVFTFNEAGPNLTAAVDRLFALKALNELKLSIPEELKNLSPSGALEALRSSLTDQELEMVERVENILSHRGVFWASLDEDQRLSARNAMALMARNLQIATNRAPLIEAAAIQRPIRETKERITGFTSSAKTTFDVDFGEALEKAAFNNDLDIIGYISELTTEISTLDEALKTANTVEEFLRITQARAQLVAIGKAAIETAKAFLRFDEVLTKAVEHLGSGFSKENLLTAFSILDPSVLSNQIQELERLQAQLRETTDAADALAKLRAYNERRAQILAPIMTENSLALLPAQLSAAGLDELSPQSQLMLPENFPLTKIARLAQISVEIETARAVNDVVALRALLEESLTLRPEVNFEIRQTILNNAKGNELIRLLEQDFQMEVPLEVYDSANLSEYLALLRESINVKEQLRTAPFEQKNESAARLREINNRLAVLAEARKGLDDIIGTLGESFDRTSFFSFSTPDQEELVEIANGIERINKVFSEGRGSAELQQDLQDLQDRAIKFSEKISNISGEGFRALFDSANITEILPSLGEGVAREIIEAQRTLNRDTARLNRERFALSDPDAFLQRLRDIDAAQKALTMQVLIAGLRTAQRHAENITQLLSSLGEISEIEALMLYSDRAEDFAKINVILQDPATTVEDQVRAHIERLSLQLAANNSIELPLYLLPTIMSSAGLPEISPQVLQRLSEETRNQMLSGARALTAIPLEIDRAKLQGKPTFELEGDLLRGRQAAQFANRNIEIEAVNALLSENQLHAAANLFENVFGESIPESVLKSEEKLIEFIKLSLELQRAIAKIANGEDMSNEDFLNLTSRIAALRETLGKASEVFSLDNVMSALGESGVEIARNSFAKMAADTQAQLITQARRLNAISDIFSGKEIPSPAELRSLVEEQQRILLSVRTVLLDLIHATGKALGEAFSRIGISEQLNLVSASDLRELLRLDKAIETLRLGMEDTDDLDQYVQKAKELISLQRALTRNVELATRTFSTNAEKINSVFGTSIDTIDFSRFTRGAFDSLSNEAMKFSHELEDALESGNTDGIYARVKAFLRRGEVLSFFNDVAGELESALYGGFTSAFERASKLITITEREFASLSHTLQDSFESSSMLLTAAERVLTLPNIAQETLDDFFSKLQSNMSIEGLMETFDAGLFAPLESPIERLIQALDSNTAAVSGNAIETVTKARPTPTQLDILENIRFAAEDNFLGAIGPLRALERLSENSPLSPEDVRRTTIGQQERLSPLLLDRRNALRNLERTNDPFKRRILQSSIDDLEYEIGRVAKFINYEKNEIRRASEEFANSVHESVSSALRDLLKGKKDEDKGYLESFFFAIINDITNTIIDSFVEALMDPITGENGLLHGMFATLGGSIRGLFFGEEAPTGELPAGMLMPESPLAQKDKGMQLDALGSPLEELVSVGENGNEIFQKGLGGIAGVFQGMIGMLGGSGGSSNNVGIALQLLQAAVGYAGASVASTASSLPPKVPVQKFSTGGWVEGRNGYDAIPAMLTNGEFVVNNRQARRYGSLLTSINSGSLTSLPSASTISGGSAPQIINVNVTGDISRQTQAEIYKMLPTIASGVNGYNREKGIN